MLRAEWQQNNKKKRQRIFPLPFFVCPKNAVSPRRWLVYVVLLYLPRIYFSSSTRSSRRDCTFTLSVVITFTFYPLMPRGCTFTLSVEMTFKFYRLKPAGLLLCPGRQSNQSSLRDCEEVRSGGKFFRFFVFGKLHHRNIPHRHLKTTSLSTEKVYHYSSSIYRESSRTVQL